MTIALVTGAESYELAHSFVCYECKNAMLWSENGVANQLLGHAMMPFFSGMQVFVWLNMLTKECRFVDEMDSMLAVWGSRVSDYNISVSCARCMPLLPLMRIWYPFGCSFKMACLTASVSLKTNCEVFVLPNSSPTSHTLSR